MGLIIVEDTIIDASSGRHVYDDLLIDDDKYIPDLHGLALAIGVGGVKATLNLSHAGRRAGISYVGRGIFRHWPLLPFPTPPLGPLYPEN